MDNLTHTAVGLFLSRAGLGRWSPRALPVILIAANLPDADIVTLTGGQLNYLHYHRHLTHSFVAMPVLAAISVALVRFAGRKAVNWRGAFFAALIALASHLALDWTNVYGVRMLLPFSGEWLRADITGVIDIWIWSVFAVAIAGPFLARLVGSEIASGAARDRHHGRGFAWMALLFLLAYDCGRGVLHARAVGQLGTRLYEGSPPLRVAAMPDTANPLRWRGLVETPGAYIVQDLNLAGVSPDERGAVYHKPAAEPVMEIARRTEAFQQFLQFSQYPLWRVTPSPTIENGRVVEVVDMRFGTPAAPGFIAHAVIDGHMQLVESGFNYGRLRPR